MQLKSSQLAAFASLVVRVASLNANLDSNPVVTLPYGSFRGQVEGPVAQFLGMPFAAPPTGERRFGLPEPPIPFTETREATQFGAACIQQEVPSAADSPLKLGPPLSGTSEDCLFINVVRPANITGLKLPVVLWLYGGGFALGDTSLYPGNSLVNRSVDLGEPVIFVSANYRVNAFGFLAGKEVKERGITNVGLRDQRFALQWIQQNIAAFGGDSCKVTLWGESAGAFSTAFHMLINGGDTGGLFHGAIMESGSPFRVPDVLDQQVYFDDLVDATNCTNAADRFECLRGAPLDALQKAVNASPSTFSYQSLTLPWVPVIDGVLITANPMQLVEKGAYARIPFITGDCEDEGTLFSQASLNVTTDAEFTEYIRSTYFPYITDEQMAALEEAYPADPAQGSPYGTGTAYAKTPEYKRIASLQGDMLFQATRRYFLEVASKTQATYSFRYDRGRDISPAYGSFHAGDLNEFFSISNQSDYIGTDAVIYFTRTYDPNPPAGSKSLLRNTYWPKWSDSPSHPLLSFYDPPPLVNITSDTYRKDAIELMIKLRKE